MKRYTTNRKGLEEAWVEVPDVWLVRDVDIYSRAYEIATTNGHSHPVRQLQGSLTLIAEGRCRAHIPGLELSSPETMDIKNITADQMWFLVKSIAQRVEVTGLVPIVPSPPSENGTSAATETNPDQPETTGSGKPPEGSPEKAG